MIKKGKSHVEIVKLMEFLSSTKGVNVNDINDEFRDSVDEFRRNNRNEHNVRLVQAYAHRKLKEKYHPEVDFHCMYCEDIYKDGKDGEKMGNVNDLGFLYLVHEDGYLDVPTSGVCMETECREIFEENKGE